MKKLVTYPLAAASPLYRPKTLAIKAASAVQHRSKFLHTLELLLTMVLTRQATTMNNARMWQEVQLVVPTRITKVYGIEMNEMLDFPAL